MPRHTTPKPPSAQVAAAKLRHFLPLAIKVQICRRAAERPAMGPSRLASWATEAFEPGFMINWCMVYKALKDKERLLALPAHCLERKTIPPPRQLQVDGAAKAFVELVVANNNTVSSAQLCMEARRVMAQLGVPPDEIPMMTKSWATRCMKRNGLSIRNMFGEAGSVKRTAVEEGRKRIQALTRSYQPSNVFNFDESAYFYRCTRTRTIAPAGVALAGRKKDKTRVTMAVGTNCSGTERLPLLIIGTAAMPVPFRAQADRINWVGSERGPTVDPLFHYAHSKKGWMTGVIFRAWLRELDDRMRSHDRSILLLIDNVSSHHVGDLGLTNVTLDFLPKNTTSVLQPMDQGIIKATKDFIYAMRDERDYNFYVQGTFTLPVVDLFTACEWCVAGFN